MRPAPTQPQAKSPASGPTLVTRPSPRHRRARLSCVMGFSHMLVFMAGASRMGARVASTTAASRSSAIPAAKRAMASAVAGAMTTMSARLASSMWPMPPSGTAANRSTATSCPDSACMVSGVMNWHAALVMTTRTCAPALTSSRHSSAALYAAMPPVTPSTTVLPSRSGVMMEGTLASKSCPRAAGKDRRALHSLNGLVMHSGPCLLLQNWENLAQNLRDVREVPIRSHD